MEGREGKRRNKRKEGRKDGRKEGRMEGRKEGREGGRKGEREEGRKEGIVSQNFRSLALFELYLSSQWSVFSNSFCEVVERQSLQF